MATVSKQDIYHSASLFVHFKFSRLSERWFLPIIMINVYVDNIQTLMIISAKLDAKDTQYILVSWISESIKISSWGIPCPHFCLYPKLLSGFLQSTFIKQKKNECHLELKSSAVSAVLCRLKFFWLDTSGMNSEKMLTAEPAAKRRILCPLGMMYSIH